MNSIDALNDVFFKFIEVIDNRTNPDQINIPDNPITPNTAISNIIEDYFSKLFEEDIDDIDKDEDLESNKRDIKVKLRDEIMRHTDIINKSDFYKSRLGTKQFWNKYTEQLPQLFLLAKSLLCIKS